MHIAMLSPIAWRTPPRHYGPWENVASLLTEGLVARGHDVTLFATADQAGANCFLADPFRLKVGFVDPPRVDQIDTRHPH